MEELLQKLVETYPTAGLVLAVLGGLVVIGTAYVAITPTKKDDAFLQKLEAHKILGSLLRLLKRFSPVQRKEKK